MKQSPFVHKFKTAKNHYIYDVNTNNIIKTSQIINDIIDDYGTLSPSAIIRKWTKKYEAKSIRESLNYIQNSYKSQGIFSSDRPITMEYPMCEKHFCESLQSKLSDLILNVTERCNLRCKYCTYSGSYYYSRKHSMRNMSWEVAKKAIDYFHSHSQASEKVYVSFYGGEPLLNFDLIKRSVEYIKKSTKWPPIIFHITTNGTSHNEEVMKFLIDNDVLLQVSIDGPSEVHDRYRVFKNGRRSFNAVSKNLQKLKEMDKDYFKDRVSFTVTLSPPYKLLEVYRFFSTNELVALNTLSVNFVNSFDTNFFNIFSDQENKSQLKAHLKILRERYVDLRANSTTTSFNEFLGELFERSLITIHRRDRKPMGKSCGPNGICVPGTRRLFVNVEGKLYPCEREGETFCIGNVGTGVERRKVWSLIKRYIDESTVDCTNCWAVRLCSLCLAEATKNHHFDYARKRENCPHESLKFQRGLILYAEIMERNPKAFDFVKDMTIE
ncbi:MAG: radical SAM protein [Gemmatimonadota bacterium]|nr:MAG: radical SAM protein [Gemmatimonadota bacterium]